MRKLYVTMCWVLLVSLIVPNSVSADIIKLKRGVSFEGKIIDETDTAYVVEMEVGVVQFEKANVEEVVWYTNVTNSQMQNEWSAGLLSNEGESTESGLLDSSVAVPTQKDLIKYKGRYVTPEVYEVVQKEKEIKERRFRFLKERQDAEEEAKKQQQRRAEELRKQQEKEAAQKQKEEEEKYMSVAEKARRFGERRTSEYGLGKKSSPSVISKNDTFKEFSGKEYEFYKNDSI